MLDEKRIGKTTAIFRSLKSCAPKLSTDSSLPGGVFVRGVRIIFWWKIFSIILVLYSVDSY